MKFRRIVTGNNKEGKACIKWDSNIEPIPMRAGFSNIPMWATKKLPAEMTEEDPNTWDLGTSLAGGCVFRLAQYEPGVAKRWHRTDSVDYAICLSGELWMQVDNGEEIHLKPGDVVIQRATNHNWENRGTEPCVMAYVLIATEGAATTGW
jgi:quercetin dioxygenase-like cupin family protein